MAAEMGQLRTEEKASQQKVASLEETVAAQQAELDKHAKLAAAIHTMTDKKKWHFLDRAPSEAELYEFSF